MVLIVSLTIFYTFNRDCCIYLVSGKRNDEPKCDKILEKGGISPEFAKHVSHAIHSLTIEDLKMYFNKKVGVNNSIPVGKDPRNLKMLK